MSKAPRDLEKYFVEGAYRFQMQFGRGAFSDFYGASVEAEEIRVQRRQWLRSTTEQYLVMMDESAPLVAEAIEIGRTSGTLPANETRDNYRAQARFLGEHWEPDYLLLARDRTEIRLVCGCVCFPSSWAVEEKIGRRIEEIHEIVPALNSSIGKQIQTFLERLKPGVSWTRSNWGLSRSAERNQHPARKLRHLDEGVALDEVFFRVEEQSLMALPKTNGILFGIRIQVTPLREFIGTGAENKLRNALETMPEAMAQYKGLATSRRQIVHLLNFADSAGGTN